jgi:hypothetical protein
MLAFASPAPVVGQAGVSSFIEAIREADPEGAGVVVAWHPNGDWSVYERTARVPGDLLPSLPAGREAIAQKLYEFEPFGDQETDLDGRPTGPGYEIRWDQLPEYSPDAQDEFLRRADAILAIGPSVAGSGEENAKLRADLAKFDADFSCEGCGAPLFDGDDFVSDPDSCHGCWAAMTDVESSRPTDLQQMAAGDDYDFWIETQCAPVGRITQQRAYIIHDAAIAQAKREGLTLHLLPYAEQSRRMDEAEERLS